VTPDDAPSPRPEAPYPGDRWRFDLLAASPYGHIVYTPDLLILDVNARHCAMTGRRREDLLGRRLFEAFPANPDDPEANAEPALRASVACVVETGEPDEMPVTKHDIAAASGGFEERFWQITHSAIRAAADGPVVAILQTLRDVTAEAARAKIHAAQQRSAAIGGKLVFFEIDLATDLVGPSDPVDVLHGFAPGHPDRHVSNYFARVHPDDRDRTITAIGGLRDAPDATQGNADYRILRPDGSVRWATARFEVVRGVEGEPPRIIGMVLDVTDLHRREVELEAAVEARDMLLAEVNHRVKNSLQLVTSVLNMEAAQAARAGEDVAGRLRAAAARVGAIATVHAALYHGEDVRSVAFGAFLDTLCRHLAEASGAGARRIALEVEAEPVRVQTDRAISLSLVVNELVTNAFKHAFPDGRGGTVRVALRRAGPGRLVLEVADDGTGMDGQELGGGDASGGLGQRLIATLARQLGAEMVRDDDGPGVRVRIDLPL
jgi:two-component sensor histidine kinase